MREVQDIKDQALAAIGKIPIVDSLLEVVCRSTGMGFAAIARVTEDRWIALSVRDDVAFGLVPGGELPITTTICHEIRQHHEAVIIDNVSEDPGYATHHTPAMYGLQSYISYPIMLKDGRFFGTLCAIDLRPHKLRTPETMGMFKLFAELISFHLATTEKLEEAEDSLKEERRTTVLREQFIAILGHDLRNPVTAISTSAQLLLQLPTEEPVRKMVQVIRNSSSRIFGLIDNMLDFAMGHLGDGIVLNRTPNTTLAQTLQQVVAEITASLPGQQIETNFDLTSPVNCDSNRIAQLLSNLLRNAVTYGLPGAPVVVAASTADGVFSLSVINQGQPIPEETMPKLFQPYSRGESREGQQGLGLGLYIAAEIARAHAGTLHVFSDKKETVFTLEMPL